MRPTISVVIPTFNRADLLLGALESVLAQSYKSHEIIVIDDGSTDMTRERLRSYWNEIRYVYQDNRGASGAQNRGVALATGEWISILASDDRWAPAKLERQVNALSGYDTGFGACFTDCRFSGDPSLELSAFERGGLQAHGLFGRLENPTKYILARHPVIWVQSLLVKRSLIEELDGFDEAMVVGEDTDLLLRLSLRTKFCFVSEALVNIDRTPNRRIGLMELFHSGDENMFLSKDHMYRKWLSQLNLPDGNDRSEIESQLRSLYYSWMIQNLYQRRWMGAFGRIQKLNGMGEDYLRILGELSTRGIRRILNSFAPTAFSTGQGVELTRSTRKIR